MRVSHPQRIRYVVWLIPALVAVLAGWAGWLLAGGVALDVGAPADGSYQLGFFERERNAGGDYRWSAPDARLTLPAVRAPAVLELHLAPRPGGSPLTVGQDGRALATLDLPDGPPRRYRILLEGPAPASGMTTIELAGAANAASADEPRPIVALVYDVSRASLAGSSLPPPLPLLLLGACGALAYALLRQAGAGGWSLPVAALLDAGLGAGWGWQRLWVAPYLPTLVIGLAVVAGLLAALRAGLRQAPATTPGAAQLFAVLAAASALIPLYLYVDFGLESWLHWHNLPILLLPLGLALLWACGRSDPGARTTQGADRQPLVVGRWSSADRQRVLAGAILLVSAGYFAGMLYAAMSGDFARDFAALFRGARRVVQEGQPLYLLDQIRANPLDATYKYPPPFALVLMPLVPLGIVPGFYAWKAINLVLLVAAVALLLRVYRVPLRSWAGAGALLLVFSLRPLTDTLGYGQVDLLLLLLVVLGLREARSQEPGARSWESGVGSWGPNLINRQPATPEPRSQLLYGVWIGLGAALKLYPAFLLGFAIVWGRWRALLGALLAGLVLGGLSLLVLGWPAHLTFLRDVLPATGAGTSWVENQTFNGFLNRLVFGQVEFVPDGGALRLATYGWALALAVLTAWLTRPRGGMRPDIGYGLWLVAMLLILPAAWMHYEALLLIPFFQAFVLAREGGGRLRWPAVACYALAWMLLAHGNLWTFFDKSLHGPFWQLILSYKFYGMLLLYGAIVLAGARRTAASAATAPVVAPAPAPNV